MESSPTDQSETTWYATTDSKLRSHKPRSTAVVYAAFVSTWSLRVEFNASPEKWGGHFVGVIAANHLTDSDNQNGTQTRTNTSI